MTLLITVVVVAGIAGLVYGALWVVFWTMTYVIRYGWRRFGGSR